ncbi:SDR family NAD(P)-dependent oxidoreductase [Histidinibacterium aquaticum]|uniref:SDR family NAD(P)-dependent oxidoreductase n=1 Tax=Histidinibacterium aquaticum TaxID=2613962 RepID=A0A5J5GGJ4_9RHOB|nr:SDR family NAD(P)-dependent oxidoreductase [Histidinibacterium aquaticum]KAA9007130.1 SDR family NAD(P)-dependent oxidoreductase [Histidinibacterium aquaticum]
MAKSILITGCSTGIGNDAAHTLAARGWQVVASVRKAGDVARLTEEGLTAVRIDYEDPQSIAEGFAAAMQATDGKLDALFNNGAYAIPGPLEDITPEALRAIFEANLIGWHDLTRQAITVMRRQGSGRIVNCSSVLGLVGVRWRGAYVATKFALEGMTDVLRQEMADAGIDVVLIEPGPIDTPFRDNAIRQFEKWIDWKESARADQYREGLLDQLYTGTPGAAQWPPSAVTRSLIRALEARRPKARYMVTTPTTAAALMRRALPARLIDRILSSR